MSEGNSILTRASELNTRSDVLIFSQIDRGKTRLAVNLANKYENVLYVAFGAMYPNVPDSWMVAQVFDVLQLKKLMVAIKNGEFDCVVWDNYNAAMTFFSPKSETPTRQEYGQMAVRWSSFVTEVRNYCDNFILTLNVVENEDENGASRGLKIDITPRAKKNIQTYFNYRYLTWKGAVQNPETKKSEPVYFVVTDPIASMNFDPTGENSVDFGSFLLTK